MGELEPNKMPAKNLALFYSYTFLQWSLKVRQELDRLSLSSPSSKKDVSYRWKKYSGVVDLFVLLYYHLLVGYWLLFVGCVCRWLLFVVGCRVMTVDCRVSLSGWLRLVLGCRCPDPTVLKASRNCWHSSEFSHCLLLTYLCQQSRFKPYTVRDQLFITTSSAVAIAR